MSLSSNLKFRYWFALLCLTIMALTPVLNCARAETNNGTKSQSYVDTEACNAAYTVLLNSGFSPLLWDQYIGQNLTADQELVFRRYDEACFRSLKEASNPRTAPFVRNILGLIAVVSDRSFQPFCSAFRVSPDAILTAGHCWCEKGQIANVKFRTISDPSRNIEIRGVLGGAPECPIKDDYSDVVLLKIDGRSIPYEKSPEEFSGELVPGEKIAIFGIDIFRLQRLKGNPSVVWPDAVVYSDVDGSRKYDRSWLNPTPTEDQYMHCLYYRSPTYPGMSGALILGSESKKQSHPGRFFVAGMHFRAGRGGTQNQCGSQEDINIGLPLPSPGTSFLSPLKNN